ncbi:MAG: DUF4097 family beta strand repeat protein [Firmicutes bacterium]|nr:DUF4097 family beta strand repeat protein [Bacillota bacterium]
MSKTSKALLIGGIILVVGLVIGLIGFALSGFKFEGLSTTNSVTNTYDVTESFENISIDVDTDDIYFLPSADGKCRVVCQESEKTFHQVSVTDKTLTITIINERSYTDFFGTKMTVTVYLPGKAYSRLDIHCSTGDVQIPADFTFNSLAVNASTGDVDCKASAGKIQITLSTGQITLSDISSDEISLETTTGRIEVNSVTCSGGITANVRTGKTVLKDVSCKKLVSTGTTGDANLKNVIAKESFSIERSTGDVSFDGCDAPEIYVKTSTGEVSGTLLSEKVFLVESHTGDIDVPKTTTGGTCTIETDTGDIEITIKK